MRTLVVVLWFYAGLAAAIIVPLIAIRWQTSR